MASILRANGFIANVPQDIELVQMGSSNDESLPPVKRLSKLLQKSKIFIIEYITSQWEYQDILIGDNHFFVFMTDELCGLCSVDHAHMYFSFPITPGDYKSILHTFLAAGNNIHLVSNDEIIPLVKNKKIYV